MLRGAAQPQVPGMQQSSERPYAAPVAPPQVMQIYGVETRSALRLSRPHDLKFFCFMKFMLVNIF